MKVHMSDGKVEAFSSLQLSPELSTAIFERNGKVQRVEVYLKRNK